MYEVECKVLGIDRKETVRRLHKLGAVKASSQKLTSIIFDTPGRDFKKCGWLLRLRTDGKAATLTMKTSVRKGRHIKTAEENEITVADFKCAKRVLEDMGFEAVGSFVMQRVTYTLGNAKVEICRYLGKYSFIPDFIEIEGPSVVAVQSAAKRLGYASSSLKPWSVHDLISYYTKRQKS
ncbi:MAG: class IV adenylate cyclase [Candidatus Micrarchaeota archaeon]|nr:class IV adenylate cyclase [Candidatus Micrarchaeota archaeon]